ncbi:hypothetical protein SAMN05443428_11012 [Caloramator quimbayensis]|uniref:Uncharacterized protein n=1 Tax=Caloramator quimbayensis TaxID=1147123 RepID=A0A1T4XKT8_9CLOT|nr:hypothetical protein [Caloramator quimbayensis]SKA90013.1 hypothetical protein SAMN05443428_11012 [Caloramator quimbayensis]
MESHQESIDLLNTSLKLCCMSMDNIKWGILYSGCGIFQIYDEKDIKKFLPSFESDKEDESLEDVLLLRCSYKKGKPLLSFADTDRKGRYMWSPNSFNKTILPSSQAFAILSLLKSIEVLEDKNTPLSYLMLLTAQNYYNFATTYMRNEDGLFISVEDKTKNSEGEIKIKPIQNGAKLIEQIFMYEALLYLYKATLKYGKDNTLSGLERYRIDSDNLFEFLYNNCNEIFELSSKELSLAVSSFVRCLNLDDDTEKKQKYRLLVAMLCAELESRIKITGEVERGGIDTSITSIWTHFKTVSALIEGYLETKIDIFKESALRTYNILLDLYDPIYSLFINGDYSKISYSIRDICEILKCILLIYSIDSSRDTLNILIDFYKSSIENSNIMQSTSFKNFNLKGYNLDITELPDIFSSSKAPVFIKSFRVSSKKSPSSITLSRQFNSFYSFYSSYIFLHYFGSVIDNFRDEENKIISLADDINNTTIVSEISNRPIENTILTNDIGSNESNFFESIE